MISCRMCKSGPASWKMKASCCDVDRLGASVHRDISPRDSSMD